MSYRVNAHISGNGTPKGYFCRQLRGPGRSTLFFLVREFHDQGPILILQDERPDWVKLSFSGPYEARLRKLIGMGKSSLTLG
jgi:hypothetical protein